MNPSSSPTRAPTDEDLEQLTALFRLLSDKTRLNILLSLSSGEQNVTHLCQQLKLPQPTVSHHLGLLRMSNIIGNRRSGKQIFYALNGRVGLGEGHALDISADRFAVRIAPRETSSEHSGAHVPVAD